MGMRFLSLLAVLVLLTGCGDKTPDTATTTTDGGITASSPLNGSDMGANPNGGAYPAGSQAELVATIGDRVFFGYDQYDLSGESRSVVERQAQWMKTNANVAVTVEGHCDERGTREYNLALGEKRAMAVRNYLIANGVDASRIQTISYGKERPAVLGSDDTSWAQNRRGVLVVQ